jgi:hypothetical protein
MADEPEALTEQVTATLEESPEDKLSKDKELFSKITGEEFGTPTPKQEKEPEPEPEEVEAEEPEKPTDPRVAAARKGLAEAGYPETSVQGASDEEALAWWNRHTEQDFDRETAKRQALDLQRRLEELEKAPEPEPEPEPVKPDYEAFQKVLADQFGDEVGQAIAVAFQSLMAPYGDQITSALNGVNGLKKTWTDAEERNTKAMTAQNRSRLQAQVPQLENDLAWKAVEDAAGALLQSGQTFLTADQLFDEAVKSLYGDTAFGQQEDKTSKQKKKIRSASPTTESRRRAPEPQTAEQKQHASDWEQFMKTEKKRKAGEYR